MFVVIYRVYVKKSKEDEYQKLWRKVASYFVEYRGAIGSVLHKTDQGFFLAYSRWPDKQTRDASWPGEDAPSDVLPEDIRQSILEMKSCVDQENKLPEITMEVVDDLLFNQA
ncbi:antibiotic biosynthesis monooxygenase [Thiotrichales bacterium 19X7-9]|nr:antibiotic biosynthesis monooxygenase [Thiotrichales bacterium 19X7-9]